MPWQGPLDNYARVVLLCVFQCALELRARSIFLCVQKGGHFGGSPGHVFLGGGVWVLETPFICNAAGGIWLCVGSMR